MTKILVLLLISWSAYGEIPHSLTKLSEIKDKNSEAYMFMAHQAAMDARYSAESALEGENSSLALKILGIGLELMPHRGDLKTLRNSALETYIKITQKLEEDSQKNCPVLQSRYNFLASVAPDAFVKLKYDRSCGSITKTTPEKINEPILYKNLEAEFKVNLSSDWKNNHFPFDDVLNNSLMLTRSLYGEGEILKCDSLKIDPASKDVDSLDVMANCKSAGIDSSFRETSFKYYGFLDHLLIVPNGTKAVMYTNLDGSTKFFKTSEALYRIYERAFDNESFDDDMIHFVVLKMTLRSLGKTETETLLAKLNHQKMKKNQQMEISFIKGAKERFETLGTRGPLFFSSEEMKTLSEVSFAIDYKASYELYKKHFEESIKTDLECQEAKKRIDEIAPSRKKNKQLKSYEQNCPKTGTLSLLIKESF
ncbi:MAG: hypothetical protein ACOVP4_03865 [Bacteriovoracaceae bacterium]